MSGKETLYNNISVETNNLDSFGWGKWAWIAHRNKANIIFSVLFAVIVGIVVVIVFTWKDQCSTKKEMTAILIGVDAILIAMTYTFIWKHTKWTKPGKSDSQFTGNNAIVRNQRLSKMSPTAVSI